MDVGAVTDLQYINNAISTARKVMEHSLHTSLGGLQVMCSPFWLVPFKARSSDALFPSSDACSPRAYSWALSMHPGCAYCV